MTSAEKIKKDKKVKGSVRTLKREYKDIFKMLSTEDWVESTAKEGNLVLQPGQFCLSRMTMLNYIQWEYGYEANEWIDEVGQLEYKCFSEENALRLLELSDLSRDKLKRIESKLFGIIAYGNYKEEEVYIYRLSPHIPLKSEFLLEFTGNFHNSAAPDDIWEVMTDPIRLL